ncbi:acyl-CoA reductase [Burkholderia mayonis]|uniref:long-chain-fatty-acyl-CoA reductase n=1 Tax=Burkholderia mayonis TaxID=1385591 RepID=A0A1B4G3R2_9BURK|nr:acyl-CoA reductase [Burkholderia mayonis]AOJ10555.1 long-chain-fatty-acyl-CoA reductase [Burkholderia mayonis]KVE57160.1 long-chain-fatty-acyl-CoA reductase [Burkholderia mayonis]
MYLIHGELRADMELDAALATLRARLTDTLAAPPDAEAVLSCAERFADALARADRHLLPDEAARAGLAAFCRREALQAKLERELGESPFSLRRPDYREAHFEAWRPLGLVVHVTPSNAALLPFMAVLEGLLAGNVNWLRPSGSDRGLSARLLAELLQHDADGQLAAHIAVLPTASEALPLLMADADGVSAWGGDAALAAIRGRLPAGCRWIDWGNRISFAYLDPAAAADDQLDSLADDICRHDQQACSSPQAMLVDSDDPAVIHEMARRLAAALNRRAPLWPALTPDLQEAAEISTRMAFHQLDQAFANGQGQVLAGKGWRLAWNTRQELAPSPLFRTVELRPAPRAALARILRPWRTHLQSCGLIAPASQLPELSRALVTAGVSRIAPAGRMHDGYHGEPHDGVYALQRLSRRVSVSLDAAALPGHAHLDAPPAQPEGLAALPVMDKSTFQSQSANGRAQLFFRSGGCSGAPKLAGFSYRDYHRQMRAAADGLLAAGLNPTTDRAMNLLYGGKLYGGMLSFFTILDHLGVAQYPMGGPSDDDFGEIAHFIVEQQINTLIGMPGTLQRLFECENEVLRRYDGVDKVFCGGEHISDGQRAYIGSFGVKLIRSAIYGSVDAGPLGHACPHCVDGEFHLLAETQWLEVLETDSDLPAAPGAPGRMVFTSREREAQQVERYDLGDLGQWLPDGCLCGLATPRFRLIGRHGALLRVGTIFVNPAELSGKIGLPMQWLVDSADSGGDRIRLLADGDARAIRARLLEEPMLNKVVGGGLLQLEVTAIPAAEFRRHPHSGKTPLVLDLRR